MNAQHTPGPWQATFDEAGGYDCMTAAYRITDVASGEPIADVDLRHYGQANCCPVVSSLSGTARAQADARLIAAAPELLEALRAITDCFYVGYRDPAVFAAHVADFMQEGRALLARIEAP